MPECWLQNRALPPKTWQNPLYCEENQSIGPRERQCRAKFFRSQTDRPPRCHVLNPAGTTDNSPPFQRWVAMPEKSASPIARRSRNQGGAPVCNRLGTTHRAKPVGNRRSHRLGKSSRRTPILRDSTAGATEVGAQNERVLSSLTSWSKVSSQPPMPWDGGHRSMTEVHEDGDRRDACPTRYRGLAMVSSRKRISAAMSKDKSGASARVRSRRPATMAWRARMKLPKPAAS